MNGIISIDPGASGGLALITDKFSKASKCPKTTEEMFTIYSDFEYYTNGNLSICSIT